MKELSLANTNDRRDGYTLLEDYGYKFYNLTDEEFEYLNGVRASLDRFFKKGDSFVYFYSWGDRFESLIVIDFSEEFEKMKGDLKCQKSKENM